MTATTQKPAALEASQVAWFIPRAMGQPGTAVTPQTGAALPWGHRAAPEAGSD